MSRREHRFPMMLNQDEVNALDDWRFANRIPTRSRAARTLIERGLICDGVMAALRSVTHALIEHNYGRELADAVAMNGWQWTDDAPQFVRPDVDAALKAIAASHRPSPKPSRREVA